MYHFPPTTVLLNTFCAAFLCVLFSSCFLCSASGEEECLKSKIMCYECDSRIDWFCGDPFNKTIQRESMKMCAGCCVKIVRGKGTDNEYIWRTCTSSLQINLFIVDHVCMEESGRQGKMCFCESEGCNSAPSRLTPNQFTLSGGIGLLVTTTLLGILFAHS